MVVSLHQIQCSFGDVQERDIKRPGQNGRSVVGDLVEPKRLIFV